MKPRLGLSLVIFTSSYAPLALLFAIRDFEPSKKNFSHPVFVWSFVVVAILSVVLLGFTMKRVRGQYVITLRSVTLRSSDLVNYTLPYLIAFFGVDFGKWQDVAALLLFLALLFFLTVRTQGLFINPILSLLGWGLYEVEFEEKEATKKGVFLSKLDLSKGGQYKMDRISQFLYVVIEKVKKENEYVTAIDPDSEKTSPN